MVLDLDKAISQLYKGNPLSTKDVVDLCKKSQEVLSKLPNCIDISAPVTVVGDIHGQFFDMLEMFAITGKVPDTNFLFLGDYVDRGYHSLEVLSLLLCLKLRYPSRVNILRGNHESRQLTQAYGFYDECLRKYGDDKGWKSLTNVFDFFPLSAVVDKKVFCVHGGLSPSIEDISAINEIKRIRDIPLDGPMCDLLWSDPEIRLGWGVSPRGAGFSFGPDCTKKFLEKNDFNLILRAHQVAMEGYDLRHDGKSVTLFSAPNYCYRCGNKGAVIELDDQLQTKYIRFEAAPIRHKFDSTKKSEYFL